MTDNLESTVFSDKNIRTVAFSDKIRERLFLILLNEANSLNKEHSGFLEEFDNWLVEKLVKRDKKTIVKSLKRVFKDITVHGSLQKNWKIWSATDLDGNAAMLLLWETWFFQTSWYKKHFIKHGTRRDKWLHVDVGDTCGLEIIPSTKNSFFNSQLVLDHHPIWPASATYIVYQLLDSLRIIKPHQHSQIKRFVDFINIIDSRGYQANSVDYKNSYKTLIGLQPFLPVKFIYKYFENPKLTGFEPMPDEFMDNLIKYRWKKRTIRKIMSSRKNKVEDSIEQINNLIKKQEIIFYWKDKFIVDKWAKLPNAMEISESRNVWIIRIYPSWDIYVYHNKGLDPDWAKVWRLVRWNILFVKKEDHDHKDFWRFFTETELISNLSDYIDSIKELESIDSEVYKKAVHEKIVVLQNENNYSVKTLKIWILYKWVISKVMKFGLFVNIWWLEWLLHKSKMNIPKWKKISEIYKIGDDIEVKLLEINKFKGELKPIWTS